MIQGQDELCAHIEGLDAAFPGIAFLPLATPSLPVIGRPWNGPRPVPTPVGSPLCRREPGRPSPCGASILELEGGKIRVEHEYYDLTSEHAVAFSRLRGGGVPGGFLSMPPAQPAILPGTMHLSLITCTEWLGSRIPAFLDAPMAAAA